MTKWQLYNEKFNNISSREKYLIIAAGVAGIAFVLYSLFLDESLQQITKLNKNLPQLQQSNKSNLQLIQALENTLRQDPDLAIKKEIAQYEKNPAKLINSYCF